MGFAVLDFGFWTEGFNFWVLGLGVVSSLRLRSRFDEALRRGVGLAGWPFLGWG